MTIQDQTIASIGLPAHAPLKDIAERKLNLGVDIQARGAQAVTMAAVLAAKGYAASTLGDGGSRGTDGTSSTERAAARSMEYIDQWAHVDRDLAQAFAESDRADARLQALIANVLHHATDIDPVPVGTGECQACGRFCRPDKDRPGNRLRSGLCPTDYRAWHRYQKAGGRLSRSDWLNERRGSFTDEQGVLHTPEPDHDIDLTSETLSP